MVPLGLLQLADSAFPAGAFAFSNGLEGLAKAGWLSTLEDFEEYLQGYLGQAASGDLPFLRSAHARSPFPAPARFPEAPSAEAPSEPHRSGTEPCSGNLAVEAHDASSAGLAAVAREWDAFLFLPAPRQASLSLGQAWLRAMEGTFGLPPFAALRAFFRAQAVPMHYLMVFAASLKAAGFSVAEAQSLHLHLSLRDQVGAAVRLGLIGSLQAQGLHRQCLGLAEALAARHGGRSYEEAYRGAPVLEMGQALHPYLYSKLFQS